MQHASYVCQAGCLLSKLLLFFQHLDCQSFNKLLLNGGKRSGSLLYLIKV